MGAVRELLRGMNNLTLDAWWANLEVGEDRCFVLIAP